MNVFDRVEAVILAAGSTLDVMATYGVPARAIRGAAMTAATGTAYPVGSPSAGLAYSLTSASEILGPFATIANSGAQPLTVYL